MFNSISHREMQIRATKKYHYMVIRTAQFFINGKQMSAMIWRNWISNTLVVELQTGTALYKTVQYFPMKLNITYHTTLQIIPCYLPNGNKDTFLHKTNKAML